MDSRPSRQARRFAAAAALLALAYVVGNALRGRAPDDVQKFEEPSRPSPAASGAAPSAAVAAAPGKPGYLRPLDAADVPPPGASRPTLSGAPGVSAGTTDAGTSAPAFARADASLNPVAASFPSGGNAPTATSSLGLAQLPAEDRGPAPTANASAGQSAQAASKPGSTAGRPPANGADGASDPGLDPRAAMSAAGFVSKARDLKNAAKGADDLSTPAGMRQAIDKEMTIEKAVDQDLRRSLSGLSPSADIEDQRGAAAAVLAAHNQPADEQSITNALGTALQPPPAAAAPPSGTGGPSPKPSDIKPDGPPYIPTEVPPRGLGPIYHKYQAAFDKAFAKFGVPPWDILALGQQESGFGANMGRTPLPKGVARRPADMAAAELLNKENRLPAPWPRLLGSETGALGPFQFEPSTQRSAGQGNPFDWNDQISYSVPHLLILNGYKANDPVSQRKAFGRYYGDGNPNGKYAVSVAAHSAAIKPVIVREMELAPGASAAPAK